MAAFLKTLRLALAVMLVLVIPAVPALAQGTDAAHNFLRGNTAFKAGDYQRAANAFKRARQAGMAGPAVSYNLGVSYFRLGDYRQAAAAFRETARYRTMRALAHYNLGLVSLRQGDEAQAQVWFTQTFDDAHDTKLKELAARRLNMLSRRSAEKRSRWLSMLSADIGHDDNVTLKNNSLAGASGKSDIFSEFFAYTQGVLSGAARDGILLKASVYRLQYNAQTAFDMTLLNAGLYKTLPLTGWRSETGLYVTNATLGGSNYLRSYNLSFDVRRQLTAGPELRVRVRYHRFTTPRSVYDYLSGHSEDLRAGARWAWPGGRVLRAYYQLGINTRNNLMGINTFSDFSPTRHTVHASYSWPISAAWTFEGMLEYRTSRYAHDYVLTSGARVQRTDDRTRAGVQLTRTLAGNTDLVLNYNYTRNSSTLNAYSYTGNIFTAGVQYLF